MFTIKSKLRLEMKKRLFLVKLKIKNEFSCLGFSNGIKIVIINGSIINFLNKCE